ncbi:hypothetical protein L218DRAFT_947027 [Marasmius fiardii PR-910]|nr:hypothetical protein L218DRAFT_947027 [Marasmius fiardii PR-910]
MPAYPVESPISEALQDASASGNGESSILVKIFVIGVFLLAMGIGGIKWLYPNTIEDIEREVQCIDEMIRENMALDHNILGDSAWRFRRKLIEQNNVLYNIKNRLNAEPDRMEVGVWIVFRWRHMRDVKANYLSLMKVKEDLTMEIYNLNQDLLARGAHHG